MGRYFGTDGFRGEAGVTLTAEHAFHLGRFLGHALGADGAAHGARARVLIGKDTRLSAYMLEYALAAGLTASGADACLLHVTTTAAVSLLTRAGGYDGGIMISASHNPFTDNGIKLFTPSGEKEEGALIEAAEAYLDRAEAGAVSLPAARGGAIGRVIDCGAERDGYLAHLRAHAPKAPLGLRIGLDCANGSAFSVARAVMEACGAAVYAVGTAPNGLNINDGVGSTHPEALAALVRREGLDAGFAFDGDADRCIAISEDGRRIDGGGILYLLALHRKERGDTVGGVVSTVMANAALAEALAEAGIPLARTPVGDRYVYAGMRARGWRLGGEPSGHVILSDCETTGDGILTALAVLGVMQERGMGLSALTAAYRPYPELQRNVRAGDPAACVRDAGVAAAIREAEAALAPHGRVLVRASGTEPLVRILVEGRDEDLIRGAADAIEARVRRAAGEGGD